jgi:hypothetical protein
LFSCAIAVLSFDQAQTKPKYPYLVCQMSEEISSRVAECTRLILVKDGFGGDTRVLEWFEPPERNTLRPFWCGIDCRSLDET